MENTTVIYEETPITVRLSDVELKDEVLMLVRQYATDVKTMSKKIARKAIDCHFAKDVKKDVIYENPILCPKQELHLEKLLWEMIIEGTIFYSFRNQMFYPTKQYK